MLSPFSSRPRPRTRRTLTIALAATSLFAVPAAAHATVTATSDETTVTVTGTDASEQIDIRLYEGQISFGGPVAAGTGCTEDEWTHEISCPAGAGGVVATMAGGDDRIHSYLADAATPLYG